jgi:hypothetical protein
MATRIPSTALVPVVPVFTNTERLALAGFLAGCHDQQARRAAFITAALDAGVPLRDVQEAASHTDPRTTMRYDRPRTSLDRHATCIVAAYVAGAAR